MSFFYKTSTPKAAQEVVEDLALQKHKIDEMGDCKRILFVMSDRAIQSDIDMYEHYRIHAQSLFGRDDSTTSVDIAPLSLREGVQQSGTPIADVLRGKKYNLVVSCGFSTSLRVAEEKSLYGITVDHICTGIEHEDYKKLQQLLHALYPETICRGVGNRIASYKEFVARIMSVRKDIKRLVLISDKKCQSEFSNDKQQGARKHLTELFEQSGVQIDYALTDLSDDFSRNVRNKISASQVAILLNEPAPNKHAESLGNFCSERGVLLVPLHLRSILTGGGLGMGVSGADYARHLTSLTYLLFVERVPLDKVKDVFFESSLEVYFNPLTIEDQYKQISPDIVHALHTRSILSDETVRGKTIYQFLNEAKKKRDADKQPLPASLASSPLRKDVKKKKSSPPKRSIEETIEEMIHDGVDFEDRE